VNESGTVATSRPNGEGTQSASSRESNSPRLSVLGYVILYVSDLSASIAFYRDVLELTFKFQDAGYAEFATGGSRLGLYERRRAGLINRALGLIIVM
jgi:catechol-2,3-dioxygenase